MTATVTVLTAPRTWRRAALRLPLRVLGVGVVILALPNLVILGLHLLAQRNTVDANLSLPVKNFAKVDDRLWRGAAPGSAGYESLAANGVVTIVDLRAEEDVLVDTARLRALGLTWVHLPMRDGQAPSEELVGRFLQTVQDSPGRVYVHCGAGVGRTGTMAAAYLVSTGQATPSEALRRNLSVGPPSLEQIAFSAGLEGGTMRRPGPALVALSRALDAPRRIWVNLRH